MPALPWIKVTVDLPHHPKLLHLQELSGASDALGMVLRLWCWVARYCADGRIPARAVPSMLAEVTRGVECVTASGSMFELGGPAESGPTLEALIQSGWLDVDGDHYVVHDWTDFQPAHARLTEQNRERQRQYRKRNALRNALPNADVTPLEESRVEEIREEKIARDEPAPASAFQAFLKSEWPDIKNPAECEQRSKEAHPGLDLLAEAKKARAWETANPRKAKSNHGNYFYRWLSKAEQFLAQNAPTDAAEKRKADAGAAKSLEQTKQRNAALAAVVPVRPPGLSEMFGKIGNGK